MYDAWVSICMCAEACRSVQKRAEACKSVQKRTNVCWRVLQRIFDVIKIVRTSPNNFVYVISVGLSAIKL